MRARSTTIDNYSFYLVPGWGSEIPTDDPRRQLVDGVIAKPVEPKILDHLLVANNNSKIVRRRAIGEEGNAIVRNDRLHEE
jgi:hypothetical protein